jgi:hypothetical protein
MGRPTMAARQLAAVAPPLQGPVASARSCAPLRMRSITTEVCHLRSRSFIGPPSSDASARCWRLRRRIRDALLLFACPVSDPTARSALRIRKEGKIDSVYGQAREALGIRRERQVILAAAFLRLEKVGCEQRLAQVRALLSTADAARAAAHQMRLRSQSLRMQIDAARAKEATLTAEFVSVAFTADRLRGGLRA